MMNFFFDLGGGKGGWLENVVGKGGNAGYHHFLLFPQCFLKASSVVDRENLGSLGKGTIQFKPIPHNDTF